YNHLRKLFMRTTSFAKVAALCGLLALSGCGKKSVGENKFFSPFSDDIVNAEKGAKSIISS
ncbi:hypothetical protein ACUOA8_50700, partial [Escherichia sp. SS-MK2]